MTATQEISMDFKNYSVGREANSYFQGSDAPLYLDGEKVALLGMRDSHPAIEVRDHHTGYGFVIGTTANDAEEYLSEEEIRAIYDRYVERFWGWGNDDGDAGWLAQDHDFSKVWSAGRSSGWLVPEPYPDFNDYINLDETPPEGLKVGGAIVTHYDSANSRVDETRVFDSYEAAEEFIDKANEEEEGVAWELDEMRTRAFEERERFFDLAVDLTNAVKDASAEFIEEVKERIEEVKQTRANNDLALKNWRY